MKKILLLIGLLISVETYAGKSTGYILQTGDKDAERLNTQNDLIKEATYDHLKRAGLCEGQVVVDIGCGSGAMTLYLAEQVGPTGHVYALDSSQEQLDVTRKAVDEKKYRNVDYILCDIVHPSQEALEPIIGNIELAYMKYVLMHLADPETAVKNILSLLKEDGVVASQESVLSSSYTEPYLPEVRDYYGKSIQLGEKLEQDKNIGNRLGALYKNAGYEIEAFYTVTHRLPMSKAALVLTKSVKSGRETLIEKGLWTEDTIDEYIKKLESWAQEDRHIFVFNQGYCVARKK